MEERDFKGIWIPKNVWLDSRLTALDKIILAEIDSLDTTEEGCYASNEHLSKFCQCSEKKITISIKKLIDLGYLLVSKFDGRRRFLKSRIEKNSSQGGKNCEAEWQNIPHSNIDSNIEENNKKILKEIVDYLNQQGNTSFKTTNKRTIALINARLKDGYTLDDFKDVIWWKYLDWVKEPFKFANGQMSDTYFRPSTLFNETNFENYLQEYRKSIEDEL